MFSRNSTYSNWCLNLEIEGAYNWIYYDVLPSIVFLHVFYFRLLSMYWHEHNSSFTQFTCFTCAHVRVCVWIVYGCGKWLLHRRPPRVYWAIPTPPSRTLMCTYCTRITTICRNRICVRIVLLTQNAHFTAARFVVRVARITDRQFCFHYKFQAHIEVKLQRTQESLTVAYEMQSNFFRLTKV